MHTTKYIEELINQRTTKAIIPLLEEIVQALNELSERVTNLENNTGGTTNETE